MSYFYVKRRVLDDGVSTEPLDMVLSPWTKDQRLVIPADASHDLSLHRYFPIETPIKRFRIYSSLWSTLSKTELVRNNAKSIWKIFSSIELA
jgi:hypothetical protein